MAERSSRPGRLTASVLMSSDMLYDLYCEVCSEDGKHLEAEGYCVDCHDYLCKYCYEGHMRNRASRNHVLQDKTTMPQQKPSPSVAIPITDSCTEKCAHHPDRLVEYYCRDDRSLGCSVCTIKDHRLCNNVDHIPDLAKKILSSQEYTRFTQKLNSLNSKSQTVIKSMKENVLKAEKWFHDAENMLKELRKNMHEAFDTFEGEFKNKTSSIKSADLTKMQDMSDKGQAVFDEVEKISAEQQSLQNNNQLGQLFVHMIQLENKVETLHALLAETDTDISVTAYSLEPGSQIQNILYDPTSIGKVAIQSSARPMLSPSNTAPVLKTPSEHTAAALSEAAADPITSRTTTPVMERPSEHTPVALSEATADPITSRTTTPVLERPSEHTPAALLEATADPITSRTTTPVLERPSEHTPAALSEATAEPITSRTTTPVLERPSEHTPAALSEATAEPIVSRTSTPVLERPSEHTPAALSEATAEPIVSHTSTPVLERPSEHTPAALSEATAEPIVSRTSTPVLERPSEHTSAALSEATAEPIVSHTTTPVLERPSERTSAALSEATAEPITSRTTTPVLERPSENTYAAHSAATTAQIVKDPKYKKAVLLSDIKVKTKSDTNTCCISGSALLPGNKIILADYDNKNVKLLNLQTSNVTSAMTPSYPWDITSITADKVVVTLPFYNKIVFVKVTNTLKMGREMSVAGQCEAILHNDGKLIVSFTKPVKIEIMNLDGTVERQLKTRWFALRKMFLTPSHMTLSLDCKSIYVADSDGGCVKRITLEGVVEAEYKDKELRSPFGITVDQHGRVLVCGGWPDNIHLLTPDLTKVKVLVNWLYKLHSLSYCHSTGRLFVGMMSDHLKVYQLS